MDMAALAAGCAAIPSTHRQPEGTGSDERPASLKRRNVEFRIAQDGAVLYFLEKVFEVLLSFQVFEHFVFFKCHSLTFSIFLKNSGDGKIRFCGRPFSSRKSGCDFLLNECV